LNVVFKTRGLKKMWSERKWNPL